jgi:hypothetical protein
LSKRPRRDVSAFRPGLSLGRLTLPWALVIISQRAAAVGDQGRGCACAWAVGASTRPGAGTSVTVRTPNACGWCGAGRRPSGRPNDARKWRSRPGMPRLRRRAVGVLHLRHNPRKNPKLRQRVVTQQKFFQRLPSVSGRGVTNHPASRAATRPSIAVSPAARRLASRPRTGQGRTWVRPRMASLGNLGRRWPGMYWRRSKLQLNLVAARRSNEHNSVSARRVWPNSVSSGFSVSQPTTWANLDDLGKPLVAKLLQSCVRREVSKKFWGNKIRTMVLILLPQTFLRCLLRAKSTQASRSRMGVP